MSENKDVNLEEKDLDSLSNRDYLGLMNLKDVPKDSEVFKEGFVSLLGGYVD